MGKRLAKHRASLRVALTPTELRVLALAADGFTAAMIGEACGISTVGVRDHLKNARHKLQAKNTTHAVAIADREGLIP
jgi:DNA-binding CsgD family transcriptional regulator